MRPLAPRWIGRGDASAATRVVPAWSARAPLDSPGRRERGPPVPGARRTRVLVRLDVSDDEVRISEVASTARLREGEGDARPTGGGGARRSGLGWWWPALGFGGSMLATLAGPVLLPARGAWWFSIVFPGGRDANLVAFYAGVVALVVAWAGLGRRLSRPQAGEPVRARALWAITALWSLPLAGGAALYSEDMYSYLAQGMILHLGLDPYHHGPAVLAHLGYSHILDAVSPFWRTTTAPYGPVFLGIISLIVSVTGSHLVVGIVVVRALELVGVALVMGFSPRIAVALGADPLRAIWLAAMSPLVMLELIAAGHNDALMAGIMVAGVAFALERRPLLGIALCALAATVKLPALAAAAFIAVAWLRSLSPERRRRFLAGAGGLVVAILVGGGLLAGVGISWLSTSVLSTPGKVQLAITPATALGWSLAALLHVCGIAARSRTLESAFGALGALATVAFGLGLLWRASAERFVSLLGVVFLIAAFAGPAAWPWYFSWGLVLLAACPHWQRSMPLLLLAGVAPLVVKANGILALPLPSAPYVLAGYAAIGGYLLWRRRSRRARVVSAGQALPGAHPAALVEPRGVAR